MDNAVIGASSSTARAALEAREILGHLPWAGSCSHALSSLPLVSLVQFLTPAAWLDDSDMASQITILRQSISDDANRVECVHSHFWELVKRAYNSRALALYSPKGNKFIHGIGSKLQSRLADVLLGCMHINNNYWIAFSLDTQNQSLMIGDSLGGSIGPQIRQPWEWWLSQHFDYQFTWGTLPIGQQTDSSSCGVYAINALHHYIDPISTPLINNQDAANSARFQMFCLLTAVEVSISI